MTAHQFLLFLPAAVLVAMSPGAGNFLAFHHGLHWGWRRAVRALLGRCAAFAVMMAAVVIGLGVLLAASAVAFTILKWAGVAYLLFLAVRLWHSDLVPAVRERAAGRAASLARREFVVAITNPKAMLLFTAFLPQFARSGRPAATDLAILGGAYILVEFAAASGYAFAGSRVGALRLAPGGARVINRISASCMAAAAGWLASLRHNAT